MKTTLIIALAIAGLTLGFARTLQAQRAHKLTYTETPAPILTHEIQSLKNQAFSGDAKAQFKLAFLYETGKGGLPKDFGYALSWYEEAARNGSKAASRKLKTL